MARRALGFPVRHLHLAMSEEDMARLDKLLYDPAKGCVPKNAYVAYFRGLLARDLARQEAAIQSLKLEVSDGQ